MKINIKIMCNDVLINEHSEGGKYYGWNNPFGDFIPLVNDIIELGGKCFDDDPKTEGKQYKIIKRLFKAYESYNYSYIDQECILQVEKII